MLYLCPPLKISISLLFFPINIDFAYWVYYWVLARLEYFYLTSHIWFPYGLIVFWISFAFSMDKVTLLSIFQIVGLLHVWSMTLNLCSLCCIYKIKFSLLVSSNYLWLLMIWTSFIKFKRVITRIFANLLINN